MTSQMSATANAPKSSYCPLGLNMNQLHAGLEKLVRFWPENKFQRLILAFMTKVVFMKLGSIISIISTIGSILHPTLRSIPFIPFLAYSATSAFDVTCWPFELILADFGLSWQNSAWKSIPEKYPWQSSACTCPTFPGFHFFSNSSRCRFLAVDQTQWCQEVGNQINNPLSLYL